MQYNYKEYINPKSIPLTKTILKSISSEKKNNKNISQIKTTKINSFLAITNTNNNTIKSPSLNNKIIIEEKIIYKL